MLHVPRERLAVCVWHDVGTIHGPVGCRGLPTVVLVGGHLFFTSYVSADIGLLIGY